MKKQLFLLVCICFTMYSFGQIKEKNAIDQIFSEWNKSDVPGAALGIVKEGKIIYANGYGSADLEHDLNITQSSVFYIGSVSKQFVTFAVLLLEEQGKLNLDDKIQKYLPDFPEYETPLTIRHFIHHTSGVRDYLTLMSLKGRSYLDHIENEEVYDLIKSQEVLNFPPGEKYLYSNSCYFMLAMIIEKAAGESLKKFAQANIFDPLGMKNSMFYDDNRELIKNKAFSYEKNDKGGFNNLIMRFDLVGSGGVYSSVEDLYLWDQNFYNNKLGKGGQAIIDKMHNEGLLNSGKSSGYAFALQNGNYKGLKTVSHGGSLAGYRSQLMRFPNQKFSVIVLANREDANPTRKSFDVADVMLKGQFVIAPKKKSTEKKAITKTSKKSKATTKFTLLQQVGDYEIQSGAIASISVKNDSLFVTQKWNGSSYTIGNTDMNTFEIPGNKTIQFIFSDLKGKSTQILTVFQNGRETVAKRKELISLTEKELNAYKGSYYSKEIDASYQIVVKDNRLQLKMPNETPMDLEASKKDIFTSDGITIRFIRKNGVISGLKVDAGRVKNLKFVKK